MAAITRSAGRFGSSLTGPNELSGNDGSDHEPQFFGLAGAQKLGRIFFYSRAIFDFQVVIICSLLNIY